MQLIFLCKDRGQLCQLSLASRWAQITIGSVALLLAGGVFFLGFRAASLYGAANPSAEVMHWRSQLAAQQTQLDATRATLQQSFDALALRLGRMNAHVVRLDALGERLTQMADLGDGEFDFSGEPSLGGPEELVPITRICRSGVCCRLSTRCPGSWMTDGGSSTCSRTFC
jgi:hypothetical protein